MIFSTLKYQNLESIPEHFQSNHKFINAAYSSYDSVTNIVTHFSDFPAIKIWKICGF